MTPTLISYGTFIGATALVIGYASAAFFKGRNSRKKEDLDTENSLTTYLQNQVKGYQKMVDDMKKDIAEMGKEISALRATIEEKDRANKQYLEILQNRNPELEQFMKESSARGVEGLKILQGITGFMESINTHMQQQNKDMTISATISKT